jgi:hypothetical protein
MASIRKLIAEGYSYHDIMEQLKLPPRTYFRYPSEAFKYDWHMLKEENNAAELVRDFNT